MRLLFHEKVYLRQTQYASVLTSAGTILCRTRIRVNYSRSSDEHRAAHRVFRGIMDLAFYFLVSTPYCNPLSRGTLAIMAIRRVV